MLLNSSPSLLWSFTITWATSQWLLASACKLVESGAVTGVDLDLNSQEHDCDACIFARVTCLAAPKVCISLPAQHFGDEIHVHTDVWGPASIATCQGRRYFATFTDDATRFTVAYLMHMKDKALAAYKLFEAWALVQGHCTAFKVLCSDRSGEFLSDMFNAHLTAAGCWHGVQADSARYTPAEQCCGMPELHAARVDPRLCA